MVCLLEIASNPAGTIVKEKNGIPTPGSISNCIFTRGHSQFDDPAGPPTRLDDEMRSQITNRIVVEKNKNDIYDDMIPWESTYLLKEHVKNKIEELEPDKHEFLPVDVIQEGTGKELGPYYFIVIYERPDIIDHDRTIYIEEGVGLGSGLPFASQRYTSLFQARMKTWTDSENSRGRPIMTFKSGGLEGRHIWRGSLGYDYQYLRSGTMEDGRKTFIDSMTHYIFVSDEFASYLRMERITGQYGTPVIQDKDFQWYLEHCDKGLFQKEKYCEWLT